MWKLLSCKYRWLRWGQRWIHCRATVFLLPLSWIWQTVSAVRHFLYDVGVLNQQRVGRPVVSIGNLAVGGTGKTPLAIALARQFSHRRLAIVSRGYGNDEIHVLRRHLPWAKFYEDADRVRGARLAVREGAELVLVDDGFQHRRLWRDFDLLIVRRRDLRGRCLPAGDLRDSPRRLKKADTLFSTESIPGKEAIRFETKVRRILTLYGQEIFSLQGERVGIFCGIANPERFKKTIVNEGALVIEQFILADHEPIGQKRLYAFYEKCKSLHVKYLVCTEKDAVKLSPIDLPVVYLEIETVITEGVAQWEKLIAKIAQKMNN